MNRFIKTFSAAGVFLASMFVASTAQAVPTITVDSSSPAGTYTVGQTINVTINFSQSVYVTGFPIITLETGPTDRSLYCNGNNSEFSTTTITCPYQVQVGDRSLDLDYQSSGAILFNQAGQKISLTSGGAAISLSLPTPGTAGSLSANEAIVVDGTGEAEQWTNPHAAVAGLHSFVMSEDLRENVSQLWSADNDWNWNSWRVCAVTIMNVTVASGTATIKTATASGFINGDIVTITGLSNSLLSGSLNATHTVASVSGKDVTLAGTYPDPLASTAVTSGTISRDCSTGNIWYKSVLKSCVDQADVDCIEGVYAQNGTNAEAAGVFDQLYPARGAEDFASPSLGVPAGGPSSLFTFSGSPHSNGNKYAVTVTLTGTKSANGTVNPPSFFASVTPVSIFTTDCYTPNSGDGDSYCMDSHNGGIAHDRGSGYRCIMWDNVESNTDSDTRITHGDGNGDISTCAKKHAFPANTKFKVDIRLSQTPKGWFHGRMASPEITLGSTGSVTNLSIKAGSVGVPAIGASGPYASFSQGVKDWFTQNCTSSDINQRLCGTRLSASQDWSDPFVRNAEVSPNPYSALSFSQLELWKAFFDDSASAVPTNWNVRTLSDSEMGSAGSCITGATGVTGVVTTNSTMYSQGPPTYSSSTGTLDYQVAAPHFLNDGVTEFLGDYNLLVREDVAQCLYGFTGTDITSSVSVVDTSGATKDAVTSLTRVDGFYKFSASGFTFSAPTIKAKLQAVQSASAPAPAVEVPAVTVPAVDVPAVTIPAVTVPAVTVPAVTVPAITPKLGTPVLVAKLPASRVVADLGMAVQGSVVRTALKVPAVSKRVVVKSYRVVLRSKTGRIVAMQTIANLKAGSVRRAKLTAPNSGIFKVEIVATTTNGVKLPKWTSPPLKLKK